MALASCQAAKSPVELSLSPVYHYQYGSISKAIAHLSANETDRELVEKSFQSLCWPYLEPSVLKGDVVLLQTDVMPAPKPHSATLKDRTHILASNNVIKGNKPLNIGYDLSYINIGDAATRWSLPLCIRRVDVQESASECALKQLDGLFSHQDLEFDKRLVVNMLDSKYGNAAFLGPAYEHENLVNLTRMRGGVKVWKRAVSKATSGAPRIYGEQFYLLNESGTKTYRHPKTKAPYDVFQRSILDLKADEVAEIPTKTRKGRQLTVKLWRYNQMMIRSKDGNKMKDKPFDLLVARVLDAESGERVFKKDMFVSINGKRKKEVSITEGYKNYRCRYDIEPYFRFAKQSLMLTSFQTPVLRHFDNYLLVTQFASWLLYTASKETDFQLRKWEQYLPESKAAIEGGQLSITQTRKSAEPLFLAFEKTPFLPKKSTKGKGRKKGDTQVPRKRYKVVKKSTKAAKNKQKIEQNE